MLQTQSTYRVVTSGTFSWTLHPDGTERTLFSGTGKVTDVCALLAP